MCIRDRFQGGQRRSGVPRAHPGQKNLRLLRQLQIHIAEPSLPIFYGPAQQVPDVFLGQGFQFEDAGAGQQRAVYLKIRIFRGGSDQDNPAFFHRGQERVLLRLVEPDVYKRQVSHR